MRLLLSSGAAVEPKAVDLAKQGGHAVVLALLQDASDSAAAAETMDNDA